MYMGICTFLSRWFGSSGPISQGLTKLILQNKSSIMFTSFHLLWFPTGFWLCEEECYVIAHNVTHVFLRLF